MRSSKLFTNPLQIVLLCAAVATIAILGLFLPFGTQDGTKLFTPQAADACLQIFSDPALQEEADAYRQAADLVKMNRGSFCIGILLQQQIDGTL